MKILAQLNLHWHSYLDSQFGYHSSLILWGSCFLPQDVGPWRHLLLIETSFINIKHITRRQPSPSVNSCWHRRKCLCKFFICICSFTIQLNKCPASPSVVLRPAAKASGRRLSEMQILRPPSRPTDHKPLGMGVGKEGRLSNLCFNRFSRWFWCHWSLRTTDISENVIILEATTAATSCRNCFCMTLTFSLKSSISLTLI